MQAPIINKTLQKRLRIGGKYSFLRFRGKRAQFVKNWLKETRKEKLCASFEGINYKIV
jgi:hypothetical protein